MIKSMILSLISLLAVVACSNDLTPNTIQENEAEYYFETSNDTHFVSMHDAIDSAFSIIENNTTRSADRIIKSCEIYTPLANTRSSDYEVSFYLINFENNKGYALVSTDDRATPVYLFAEEGNISVTDIENNQFISMFFESAIPNYVAEIENYEEDITYNSIITDIIPPHLLYLPTVFLDGKAYFCKTITEIITTTPMVYAYWHQSYPYNKYAGPYTGCGINSVGQIMSYYQFPTTYHNSTYDWDLINQQSSYTEECPASNMIAQLMYDMGDYLDVDYGAGGTSTTNEDSRNLFIEFGYTCSQITNYTANTSYIIENEIDNNRPIWIRGDDNGGVGHAWVIDGYKRTEIIKEYYQKISPYALYRTTRDILSTYYRCIWGLTNDFMPVYCLRTEFYLPDNIQFLYNIKPR